MFLQETVLLYSFTDLNVIAEERIIFTIEERLTELFEIRNVPVESEDVRRVDDVLLDNLAILS
jgi:hypothetical protein